MKNKKIIVVIIGLIILLIILIVPFIIFSNKKENVNNQSITQEQMEEKIDIINDNMNSRNPDLDKVSEEVGYEVDGTWTFLGSDSLYEFKLPENVKGNQNFKEYENAQEKYLTNMDKLINENFDYEIIKHEVTEYSVIDTIRVKSFYGILYSLDQNTLMSEILKMAGYNPDEMINNNEWQIAYYKAKIKSMQILNENINFYGNKDEYLTFELIYDITDDGLVCYNCNNYFELLKASGSSKVDMSSEESMNEFYEEQNKRIQNYLNKALESGMLDKNHPLDM